jgi:hypothetical protein
LAGSAQISSWSWLLLLCCWIGIAPWLCSTRGSVRFHLLPLSVVTDFWPAIRIVPFLISLSGWSCSSDQLNVAVQRLCLGCYCRKDFEVKDPLPENGMREVISTDPQGCEVISAHKGDLP